MNIDTDTIVIFMTNLSSFNFIIFIIFGFIGVTNSGMGMSEFAQRKKHKF
jgi:hypothetical protein